MMMFSLFACLSLVVAFTLDCLELIVPKQSFFNTFCRCVSRLASCLLGLRVAEGLLAPRESLLYVVRQDTLFDVLVMLAFADSNGLSHERLFLQLSNQRGPFRFVRIVCRVARNETFSVEIDSTAGPVVLLLNDNSRAAVHVPFRSVVYVAVWYDEQRVQHKVGTRLLTLFAAQNCLIPRTAHIVHDTECFAVVDSRVEERMPMGADEKREFEFQMGLYNYIMFFDWPRLPSLFVLFYYHPLITFALFVRVLAAHLHLCLFRRASRSSFWLFNITVVVDFSWRMLVLSWWWARLLHCFCLLAHINVETGFACSPTMRKTTHLSYLIWNASWLLMHFVSK
eukprot:TRINITY_DN4062_c0_g1_i1.p1 TRINITY_DN4062_c0_g1~~TRINITY_DN4062_c0_g1_i1.p1  ORF type:complete len:346 (-),score=16.76 TRINITY_DN4062_c0_g1_i1:8-1024(-)